MSGWGLNRLNQKYSFFMVSFVFLACVPFSVFAVGQKDLPADIVGEAFDLESGAFLYRELHFLSPNLGEHRVAYQDQEGKIIAEKNLDFDGVSWQPSMRQRNEICGELIDVEFSSDSENLTIDYRADSNARFKQKTIKNSEALVVDAGFDALLQKSWQELIAGETIRFDYLAPSQLNTFLFQAEKTNCAELDGADLQCFSVQPKRWWMKVLLDPIIVSYDSKSRNLMSFKGLGNIANSNCDYMKVDIRYEYLSN